MEDVAAKPGTQNALLIEPHSLSAAPKLFANHCGVAVYQDCAAILFGIEGLKGAEGENPILLQSMVFVTYSKFAEIATMMAQTVEAMKRDGLLAEQE